MSYVTDDRIGAVSSITIADGLFTWPSDHPTLLGARCETCATFTFPSQEACPKCSSEAMTTVPLSTRGRLWTWTSQEFRPKSPPYSGPDDDPFEPYFVGYIELPEQLHVEARLAGYGDRSPQIGDEMELVIVPFTRTDDGTEVVTFAFQPVDDTRSDT